jgi:hypothetical protein
VKPEDIANRLRGIQGRVAQLPDELERVARANVLQGIPRTVSVTVTRQPGGVRVILNGRGARAHMRRIRGPLSSQARAAVQQAVRF